MQVALQNNCTLWLLTPSPPPPTPLTHVLRVHAHMRVGMCVRLCWGACVCGWVPESEVPVPSILVAVA